MNAGVASYLCDLPENVGASQVHGVIGKKRLVAGAGSDPISLSGTTTAFGLSTPVPSDGFSSLVYDLDADMVCAMRRHHHRDSSACSSPSMYHTLANVHYISTRVH